MGKPRPLGSGQDPARFKPIPLVLYLLASFLLSLFFLEKISCFSFLKYLAYKSKSVYLM